MRYEITEGPNEGKMINIPDNWLQTNIKNLELTLPEAIDMYLSDEGLLINPLVAELTTKAKTAGAGAKATGEKAKRKAPERKPDEVKRAVIAALAEFIGSTEHVTDVDITNIERMVAFKLGDDNYEITLTKKRKPKE